MKRTIENEWLRVTADNHGAEIVSIFDKRRQRECVWNADGSWWKRHTPVLFPIVGSIWHNTMRAEGSEYHMTQHGFARDMDFDCICENAARLEFSLKSSDETKAKYPYDFELRIAHTLDGSTVTTSWTVVNTGSRTLHFQIGGHPAFMIPDVSEDYDTTGTLRLTGSGSYELTEIGAEGCVKAEPIQLNTNEIAITRDTFKKNALIFESPCPQTVELLDRSGNNVLTFHSPSPSLGLWAPSKDIHAPFVCIEPWWGRTDREGYEGEFKDREYMNHIAAGEEMRGEWAVRIGIND
ncbi:MAG: aldose 1-epimerase family protein [Bacteroidaceae bacterium]|nr:aldose 1-epimerase family protein [Bacteroidaceae bacterium]